MELGLKLKGKKMKIQDYRINEMDLDVLLLRISLIKMICI